MKGGQSASALHDLAVDFVENAGRLEAHLKFAKRLFAADFPDRLMQQLQVRACSLCAGLSAHGQLLLRILPIMLMAQLPEALKDDAGLACKEPGRKCHVIQNVRCNPGRHQPC